MMIDPLEIALMIVVFGGLLALTCWNVRLRIALQDARHEATHDELTGLPNRRALLAHLRALLADGTRPVSAAIIDLDHFKEINDRFGHAAGDAVLSHAGRTLGVLPLHNALVGRLSGDEFLIVTDGGCSASSTNVETVAAALADAVALADATLIPYRVSIGHATADHHDHTVENLLRKADSAMYAAKGQPGGVAQYQPWMQTAGTIAARPIAARRRRTNR
jgi:diguanylate cyclase (GGDEF)-like protein